MNPYEVLGVSENADEETIKKAYKELVKKYHPDRYINNPLADLAAEKMKEINKAYDIITNKLSPRLIRDTVRSQEDIQHTDAHKRTGKFSKCSYSYNAVTEFVRHLKCLTYCRKQRNGIIYRVLRECRSVGMTKL